MTFGYARTRFSFDRTTSVVLLLLLLLLVAPSSPRNVAEPAAAAVADLVSVIVREQPAAGDAPEALVERTGGRVTRQIGLIDGFAAVVPPASLAALESSPLVHSVTPNRKVHLLQTFPSGSEAEEPLDGSMAGVANSIKAKEFWQRGHTGQGVDVALIDSGVVPVDGLTVPGKVINGADLSFESQDEGLRHLDTFGHGTHLAGIIAGKDGSITSVKNNSAAFQGIAPDARLVSVKVANSQGATDVSQVLAAIDWVVQHRNDNGMNIRVLNLSFGTDGIQDYRLDPLTYAAEVAWRKGIVVVVAAGNSQFGSPELNNPAYDPYVLAVGAADTKGTYDPSDDVVPGWSARGDGTRGPDLVAPGRSVVSLRNPGSQIDVAHPSARVGERFFKGTGTSQSAAVVSGAAALVVSQRPEISPDGVKALLTSTARPLSGSDPEAQGAGVVDLKAAYRSPTPETVQSWPLAEGTGSLDAARGTGRVVGPDGVELSGEVDIFGTPWDGVSWSGASWNGVSWSGASWNGVTWSGASWNGVSWSGASWSGVTWSGASWSGVTWSGASWSGVSWSGASWSGVSWSGVSWSAAGWGE